ncbi:hypothetical protein CQJ94_00160 [Glycomyces fuscus]|nr:hypothetical protein CQJ94_00160 [Glycomyces fuscus]
MSTPVLPAAPAAARPLRAALRTDALACAGSGLVMAAGSALLSGPLGLPTALLLPAGLFLLPFAALLWLLAARAEPGVRGVRAVLAVNALWILGSVAVAALLGPTVLGVVFVLAQAAAVLGISAAEAFFLRGVLKGSV